MESCESPVWSVLILLRWDAELNSRNASMIHVLGWNLLGVSGMQLWETSLSRILKIFQERPFRGLHSGSVVSR